MDEPDYWQALFNGNLLVIGREVVHPRGFEQPVAPIHLGDKFCESLVGKLLVVDDAAVQLRQSFEGEVVNALLRIDEDYAGLGWCVGCCNGQDDVLDQHRLPATRASGDECVGSVKTTWGQVQRRSIVLSHGNEQILIAPRRWVRLPVGPELS